MASKIERNVFGPFINGFSFEQAFDGNIWELRRGEDFTNKAGTVANALRDEYYRRYGRIEVKAVGDDKVVVQRVLGAIDR